MHFPDFIAQLLEAAKQGTVQALCRKLDDARKTQKLTTSASLIDDIGLDSMMVQEIVMLCEETFQVHISEEVEQTINTLHDLFVAVTTAPEEV